MGWRHEHVSGQVRIFGAKSSELYSARMQLHERRHMKTLEPYLLDGKACLCPCFARASQKQPLQCGYIFIYNMYIYGRRRNFKKIVANR